MAERALKMQVERSSLLSLPESAGQKKMEARRVCGFGSNERVDSAGAQGVALQDLTPRVLMQQRNPIVSKRDG